MVTLYHIGECNEIIIKQLWCAPTFYCKYQSGASVTVTFSGGGLTVEAINLISRNKILQSNMCDPNV